MRWCLGRSIRIALFTLWLVATLSCARDQELQSITIQPGAQTFGASNIPVIDNTGLAVQLRALGNYIHPPVTKDITDQVTWTTDAVGAPPMFTLSSKGVLTATGSSCGSSLVSATVQTNSDTSGRSSSGAIVTGSMSASVICFSGGSSDLQLNIQFLGSGTGTVSVVPSQFICQQNCDLPFPPGTGPITLTATPTSTAAFGGWSSNCPQEANANVCTINVLNTNTTVDVTFN